jgi:cytochrome c-type biogenesis protein CcmF
MRSVGQLCLLMTLVGSGYAAFVCTLIPLEQHGRLRKLATACGMIAAAMLTTAMLILAVALVTKDFSFAYVAQYSSRLLSWQYSLAALWVGQAGSLLLWAWVLAALSLVFRFLPTADAKLRETAFGLLMANLCFMTAILVFAADPMKASLEVPDEGLGLSPLLQHPSMLIHPPVVLIGYALWTVPFSLAVSALLCGKLDATWTQMARPWALLAWVVLGSGVLLGAHWAYQELGWGGYWGWDPVENGSLLPWLTGTALIHGLMAWRYRNCQKKITLALAIVTFGLCNFATFLTRSGIFSSVHAFSQSPIGWMFLGLMAVLLIGGVVLIWWRREALPPERVAKSMLARETLILITTFLLITFTLVVMVGTLAAPLSQYVVGRTIQVGAPFYNNVLTPVALVLLATTATVPLLRWGDAPSVGQRRALLVCLGVATVAAVAAYGCGVRHPVLMGVAALSTMTVAVFVTALWQDARRREPGKMGLGKTGLGAYRVLGENRRQYAGYAVHLGLACLAIGVAGSSLGTGRYEVEMNEGDAVNWSGRTIRYVQLEQRSLPDKLVAEAVLEVSRGGATPVTLRPARHLHLLQDLWTTEVDIHSTWRGDFYTILNAGLGEGRVALTFVDNPMISWIWFGGVFIVLSVLVGAWPASRRRRTINDARNQATAFPNVPTRGQRRRRRAA